MAKLSTKSFPKLMSLDTMDDKSTLVQVLDWCFATNDYLSQYCWAYGVTGTQWVKINVSRTLFYKQATRLYMDELCTADNQRGQYSSQVLKKHINISQLNLSYDQLHSPDARGILRAPSGASLGHLLLTWINFNPNLDK